MYKNESIHDILVFSYGSNMSLKRITGSKRCPQALFFDTAKIKGYRLVFNKISKDGSCKANLQHTGHDKDIVYGIVYRIPLLEKKSLDEAEGKGHGYEEITISVILSGENRNICCQCYIAYDESRLSETLKPYNWYMEHCIRGASEFKLPENYLDILKAVPFDVDKNTRRSEEEMSIYLC